MRGGGRALNATILTLNVTVMLTGVAAVATGSDRPSSAPAAVHAASGLGLLTPAPSKIMIARRGLRRPGRSRKVIGIVAGAAALWQVAPGQERRVTAHAAARSSSIVSNRPRRLACVAMDIPSRGIETLVDHPLAKARLSTLRDARTDNAMFRAALRDLTLMLIYEATRDAPVATAPLLTPVARTTGYRLAQPPLLVPVLRAGLGMVDAAHALIPEAQIGFVGVARDEKTHEPVPYMESLPESLAGRPVFVLDPMLATGGSMAHTIRLLTDRGATDVTAICVLAAPEGLEHLRRSGLPVRVVTASVDERLNDSAFIVPGLGDAGDRQFGAV